MPAVFDKFGIRFQYPENWILEDDEGSTRDQVVSVYSPGGAFWTLVLGPASADPAEMASAAVAELDAEYDDFESEATSERIGDVDMIGFDVNFICLDLTNTAWVRAWSDDRHTYLLLCQAEDRDFEQLQNVFRAMTVSLLSNQHVHRTL
jgi:hypothetical protein